MGELDARTPQFTATYIEYHPVGSEGAATLCAVVGTLAGDDTLYVTAPSRLTPLTNESFASELFELDDSFEFESTDVCALAIGPLYNSIVDGIARARDSPSPVFQLISRLRISSFGVKLFLSDYETCHYVRESLWKCLLDEFDNEMRVRRHDSPFMAMLWETLSQAADLPASARIARGVALYRRRRDSEKVLTLLADAYAFESLDEHKIDQLVNGYERSLNAEDDSAYTASKSDYLALNAKFDLLAQKVNRVESAVQMQGSNAGALADSTLLFFVESTIDARSRRPRSDLRLAINRAIRRQLDVRISTQPATFPEVEALWHESDSRRLSKTLLSIFADELEGGDS